MIRNDATLNCQTPRRWRRSGRVVPPALRLLTVLLLLGVAAGCGGTTVTAAANLQQTPGEVPEPRSAGESDEMVDVDAVVRNDDQTLADPDPPAMVEPDPTPTPTPHPVAVADTDLPPAPIGFDDLFTNTSTVPQPISIEIENINVRNATVIPVGVDEELAFEVPPADQVGWYEFGSAPGEPGSAVLAAHIAYNGVDGVFRYLEDVEIGSVVVVGFDDGSTERYRIEDVTEYVKEALPDSLFDRDGREQLALITCGGNFNYQLDSYDSNTVAIAVPIEL